MSRLTDRNDFNGMGGFILNTRKEDSNWYAGSIRGGQAVDRLGELEDIIYAPDGTEIITPDRLRELVEADRDGRVMIRPDCRTCAHRSLIKYRPQCFGCLGQERYGMEKGNNYQPRAEAEAALAGQEDKP